MASVGIVEEENHQYKVGHRLVACAIIIPGRRTETRKDASFRFTFLAATPDTKIKELLSVSRYALLDTSDALQNQVLVACCSPVSSHWISNYDTTMGMLNMLEDITDQHLTKGVLPNLFLLFVSKNLIESYQLSELSLANQVNNDIPSSVTLELAQSDQYIQSLKRLAVNPPLFAYPSHVSLDIITRRYYMLLNSYEIDVNKYLCYAEQMIIPKAIAEKMKLPQQDRPVTLLDILGGSATVKQTLVTAKENAEILLNQLSNLPQGLKEATLQRESIENGIVSCCNSASDILAASCNKNDPDILTNLNEYSKLLIDSILPRLVTKLAVFYHIQKILTNNPTLFNSVQIAFEASKLITLFKMDIPKFNSYMSHLELMCTVAKGHSVFWKQRTILPPALVSLYSQHLIEFNQNGELSSENDQNVTLQQDERLEEELEPNAGMRCQLQSEQGSPSNQSLRYSETTISSLLYKISSLEQKLAEEMTKKTNQLETTTALTTELIKSQSAYQNEKSQREALETHVKRLNTEVDVVTAEQDRLKGALQKERQIVVDLRNQLHQSSNHAIEDSNSTKQQLDQYYNTIRSLQAECTQLEQSNSGLASAWQKSQDEIRTLTSELQRNMEVSNQTITQLKSELSSAVSESKLKEADATKKQQQLIETYGKQIRDQHSLFQQQINLQNSLMQSKDQALNDKDSQLRQIKEERNNQSDIYRRLCKAYSALQIEIQQAQAEITQYERKVTQLQNILTSAGHHYGQLYTAYNQLTAQYNAQNNANQYPVYQPPLPAYKVPAIKPAKQPKLPQAQAKPKDDVILQQKAQDPHVVAIMVQVGAPNNAANPAPAPGTTDVQGLIPTPPSLQAQAPAVANFAPVAAPQAPAVPAAPAPGPAPAAA